jgi:hypothetical protein
VTVQVTAQAEWRCEGATPNLNDAELLSPRAFVQACRNGSDAIIAAYPTITPAQTSLLAGASAETLMLAAGQPGRTAVMTVVLGIFRLVFIDKAIDRLVASGHTLRPHEPRELGSGRES